MGILLTVPLNSYAQTTETVLTGRVVDQHQRVVPGTNIVIKGTSLGTCAGVDGNFKLNYSGREEKVTLIVAYMGYASQEKTITLSEGSRIDVVMRRSGSGSLRNTWLKATSMFRR